MLYVATIIIIFGIIDFVIQFMFLRILEENQNNFLAEEHFKPNVD